MTAMPASRPATATGCSVRPLSSRSDGRELHDDLDDRAGAEAEQERGDARVVGGRADPRAEHRGRAGDQAEQRRGGRRDGCASASGATIARPSVVLWIAKPTTRNAPSASAPTA